MEGMMQRGIVLSAVKFDFLNDAKEKVSGCTVKAIMADNLAPYVDSSKPAKGRQPAKFTLPMEVYDTKIVDAPGLYDFHMELTVDSDGKMKAVPKDLTFVKALMAPKPKA